VAAQPFPFFKFSRKKSEMNITATPYERIILDAYNTATAYRETVGRSGNLTQAAILLEVDSYLAPEPPAPGILDELDNYAQYEYSLAAAEVAFKIGLGEVLADYLLMRLEGSTSLAAHDTVFKRLATSVMDKLLLGVRSAPSKPSDIPEVQAAYQYRVRMIETLHHLMLNLSRKDMNLPTDWLTVNRKIVDLQLA
jgi:hypothetical protein